MGDRDRKNCLIIVNLHWKIWKRYEDRNWRVKLYYIINLDELGNSKDN